MAVKRETDEMRLAKIQAGLGCSVEEAREILAYDKKIDKEPGVRHEYDLPLDKEKVAASYMRTGTRKTTAYKFGKKEAKPDATKESFIATLAEFVTTFGNIQNVEIVNKTREISFTMGDEKFSVTLVRKRK